jgi:hypothetical protein
MRVLQEKSKALSSKFHRYYQTKLKTNIKEKVQVPFSNDDLQKMLTNNNSESLNHVLKQAIDWKSQPLLDIVNFLTKIIETQCKDLKRALVNTDEYRLCDSHKQFSVTKIAWVSKTDEERRRLYRRFRLFIAKDKDVVTSTDGQTYVRQSRSMGRKIGQRKRKIKERTTTYKRTKTADSD